jgi:L,D-transpeptidase-like protein
MQPPRPSHPERTVDSVAAALEPRVRTRWEPYLRGVGLDYPPAELALLAFKRERRLEVWGRRVNGRWARIDALPILAASGVEGPKLRQGDGQVPEGVYRIIAFNPNSRFHLSMMLDYPNLDDVAAAAADGRIEADLGGEIFIHGGARSIGCLAMGDRAIEDLFVLVADVGMERVQVILAPRDPRGTFALAPVPGLPWTAELYRRIEDALAPFAPSGALMDPLGALPIPSPVA